VLNADDAAPLCKIDVGNTNVALGVWLSRSSYCIAREQAKFGVTRVVSLMLASLVTTNASAEVSGRPNGREAS